MKKKVLIVSDSTGATAEHVFQAALAQFLSVPEVEIERRPQIRTPEQIAHVVDEAFQSGALIVHTLAPTPLRREIYFLATEKGVPAVDLLGNVLSDLSSYLGATPQGVPGGIHQYDDAYYKRVDALTFAVKHDDGLGVGDFGNADIVLVGVSRTSKTPLSIYLAVRGYLVANVPMVLGIPPPQELFEIPQKKIVALRMDPGRLIQLREKRLKDFRREHREAYTDPSTVRREVDYAESVFRKGSWPVVDVTEKALEEVAVEVLSLAIDLPYLRTLNL